MIVASAPPMPGRPEAELLLMMTPVAPAVCAFLTLVVKVQVPRSRSTSLPVTAAPLVRGEQPSVVLGPAPSAGSKPTTTLPVIAPVICGPKEAACAILAPAMKAGLLTSNSAVRVRFEQAPVRAVFGLSVPRPLIWSTVSPKMSEYDSFRAPGCQA